MGIGLRNGKMIGGGLFDEVDRANKWSFHLNHLALTNFLLESI